jgi:hypothetical protein
MYFEYKLIYIIQCFNSKSGCSHKKLYSLWQSFRWVLLKSTWVDTNLPIRCLVCFNYIYIINKKHFWSWNLYQLILDKYTLDLDVSITIRIHHKHLRLLIKLLDQTYLQIIYLNQCHPLQIQPTSLYYW